MMRELKPCPFCGSDEVFVNMRWGNKKCYFYYVKCEICGGTGGSAGLPQYYEPDENVKWNNYAYERAIARWNSRAEL